MIGAMKLSKIPDKDEIDGWLSSTTRMVALQVLEILNVKDTEEGVDYSRDLQLNFLAAFISAMVYKALTENLPKTKTTNEKYQYSLKAFQNVKSQICEAVSAGMQGAMATYSGKTIEYYVTIKPVPDNKVDKVH